MTNYLADGVTWSHNQMEAFAGRTVELFHGTGSTGDITAVAAEMEYDVLDVDGWAVRTISRDYFILAANVVVGDVEVDPRNGDTIVETIDGVEHTFQVMNLGARPAAELMGDGLRWKIHTKRIE